MKALASFALSLVLLAACGRSSQLTQDESAQFQAALNQQLGSDSALANTGVQDEIQKVTSEIQSAIAQALFPAAAQDIQSLTAFPVTCVPQFSFVLVGVNITFTPGPTCILSGTVALKLFPATAAINLDVVGLQFVEKIVVDANVALQSGSVNTVSLEFLNGQIGLKLFGFGPIVLNGQAGLSFGNGVFQLNSRLNAFEGSSGVGVALLAKVDAAASVRQIQGCILNGGASEDPQGGTLTTCFKLGI